MGEAMSKIEGHRFFVLLVSVGGTIMYFSTIVAPSDYIIDFKVILTFIFVSYIF